MSTNYMAVKIALVHDHSASQQELLEGLFPAYELIQRALRVVDDGMFNEVAQPSRDTFKSEAQTFLDAARQVSKDASAGRYPQTSKRGGVVGPPPVLGGSSPSQPPWPRPLGRQRIEPVGQRGARAENAARQ